MAAELSRRRGGRTNCSVPVELGWMSDAGEKMTRANACVVNFCGCMLIAESDVPLNQQVILTNQATRRSVEAVVVWKGKQRREGWELGIELIGVDSDFWGIEL